MKDIHKLGKPPVNILLTVSRRCFFRGSCMLVLLHVGVWCTIVSVNCSLMVTCCERADPLGCCVCCGHLCFVTFPNAS